MTRKRLAVLTGGNSVEAPSAYDATNDVLPYLDHEQYDIFVVDIKGQNWLVRRDLQSEAIATIDKTDFSFSWNGAHFTFDGVFMIIHGGEGEDGSLQGYFELLNIPYTGSGVLASALCHNKHRGKLLLEAATDVALPKGVLVKPGQGLPNSSTLPFPCIVKPNKCGSSFGVSLVKNHAELYAALDLAFRYDDEVLVEEVIKGTEVTIGTFVSKDGLEYVLPPTETVFVGEVFDTASKLQQDATELITPARISDDVLARCQEAALKVYGAIGCAGLVRIDFIIREGIPYFIEVNTIPGMRLKSSIPRQIMASGIGLTNFFNLMIEDALAPVEQRIAA